MNLKNTENFVVLGLFLAVLGGIAALLLAYISGVTAGPIAAAEARAVNTALQQVLPAFDNRPAENRITVKDPAGREVVFFGALKDGRLVGVAGQGINPRGYAGAIEGLVGLEPDGRVRTVLITKQNETPGLGANVCQRKAVKTIFTLFKPADKGADVLPPNPTLDQFSGKSAGDTPWRVSKDGGDCRFVTGATVTSRAVTELCWDIARAYEMNQQTIEAQLGGAK